jgi:hypothetical protein
MQFTVVMCWCVFVRCPVSDSCSYSAVAEGAVMCWCAFVRCPVSDSCSYSAVAEGAVMCWCAFVRCPVSDSCSYSAVAEGAVMPCQCYNGYWHFRSFVVPWSWGSTVQVVYLNAGPWRLSHFNLQRRPTAMHNTCQTVGRLMCDWNVCVCVCVCVDR